jgi:hypothetical protein
LINEIHEKLDGAAFNGGFETLAQNVENIEKTQREMLSKMEEVHKVIYEPDDGLFARVKRVEAIHDKELAPLRKELLELHAWKEKLTAKDGVLTLAAADNETVKELTEWKKKILAFILAAAGSTLLMVIKTAWDFIKDHVTLH